MALNNLAGGIQNAIQTNTLRRQFEETLTARLGFRYVADPVPFPAGTGESLTSTRVGLLPSIVTPLPPADNLSIQTTNGLVPQTANVEQYTLTVQQYAANMMLNQVTSRVAIASVFLKHAELLAEQAFRSVDTLAANALFNAGMSGNAMTISGGSSTTLNVDSTAGFTSTSVVTVNNHAYTLSAVTNAVLTSSGVAAADYAAGNTVVSPGGFVGTTVAGGSSTGIALNSISGFPTAYPYVVRINNNSYTVSGLTTAPSLTSTGIASGDYATGQYVVAGGGSSVIRKGSGTIAITDILKATNMLRSNNVPPMNDGFYACFMNPNQLTGLYSDSTFQSFFRGQINTMEYRQGVVAELLGVRLIFTNLGPAGTVGGIANSNRAIVVGKDALVEGRFTPTGYANALGVNDGVGDVTMVNGIAHVTRAPIDPLQQIVTQSWAYIGGFVAPTDVLTTANVLPTASSANFKRAVVIEST